MHYRKHIHPRDPMKLQAPITLDQISSSSIEMETQYTSTQPLIKFSCRHL